MVKLYKTVSYHIQNMKAHIIRLFKVQNSDKIGSHAGHLLI